MRSMPDDARRVSVGIDIDAAVRRVYIADVIWSLGGDFAHRSDQPLAKFTHLELLS